MEATFNSVYDDALRQRDLMRKARRSSNPDVSEIFGAPQGVGSTGQLDKNTYLTEMAYTHDRGEPHAAVRPVAQRIAGQPIHVAEVVNSDSDKPGEKAWRPAKRGRRRLSIEEMSRLPKGIRKRLRLPTDDDHRLCVKAIKSMHSAAVRVDILEKHPVLDLLNQPNVRMSGHKLMELTIVSLYFTGKCFWWLHKAKNRPFDMYYIEAHRVREMPDNVELDKGYLVSRKDMIGGTELPVPAERMIYIYHPDPADIMKARAEIKACMQNVRVGESITMAQEQTFNNGCFPALAFITGDIIAPDKTNLGKAQLERWQLNELNTRISQLFQGPMKNGKHIVLDRVIDKVERISDKPNEMDWMDSYEFNTEAIWASVGTPPIVAGRIKDANRATALVADEAFCLPSGSPVLTRRGWMPIERIDENDDVMTHLGRWRKVTGTSRREVSESIASIKVRGHKNPERMTKNHPVLVLRDGIESWTPAGDVVVGDRISLPRITQSSELAYLIPSDYIPCTFKVKRKDCWREETWLRKAYQENTTYRIAAHCGVDAALVQRKLDEIGVDKRRDGSRFVADTLPIPRQTWVKFDSKRIKGAMPKKTKIDKWLAMWLGLYMAEGHCHRYTVAFTIHEKERGLKSIICDGFRKITDSEVKFSPHPENHGIQIYVGNSTLCQMLTEMFGKGARHKRIPSCVFDWPEELRIAFLAGYILGDGDFRKGAVGYRTSSKAIADGMRVLCAGIGGIASVGHCDPNESEIRGRPVRSARAYYGVIGGNLYRRIAEMAGCDPHIPDFPKPSRHKLIDGKVWSPVEAVGEGSYSGPVFNISVEEDESYLLPIGAVHNCNNVTNPLSNMLSHVINDKLLPLYNTSGEDLVMWIEEAKSFDRDAILKEVQFLTTKGGMPLDEARSELGRGPLPNDKGQKLITSATDILEPLDDSNDDMLQYREDLMAEQAEAGKPPAQPSGGGKKPPQKPPPSADATATGRDFDVLQKASGPVLAWLKVHSRQEQSFARDLKKFLDAQVTYIVQQIRDQAEPGQIFSPRAQLFNPREWDKGLVNLAMPHLLRCAMTGAATQLGKDIEPHFTKQDVTIDFPEIILQGIRNFLTEMVHSRFWMQINDTTAQRLATQVQVALQTGESISQMSKRVHDALGSQTPARALAIARSETTGSLNAGQKAAADDMIDRGIITGTKWFANDDAHTRPTHWAAHDQHADENGEFTVGGEKCRFPGDPNLSAANRINCRCALVSVIGDDKSHDTWIKSVLPGPGQLFERVERRFIVDAAAPIIQQLLNHGKIREYGIKTLYLDHHVPTWSLRRGNGVKFRLRRYDTGELYFEQKVKRDGMTYKKRHRTTIGEISDDLIPVGLASYTRTEFEQNGSRVTVDREVKLNGRELGRFIVEVKGKMPEWLNLPEGSEQVGFSKSSAILSHHGT